MATFSIEIEIELCEGCDEENNPDRFCSECRDVYEAALLDSPAERL